MPQNRIVTLVACVLAVFDLIWFIIRGVKNGFVKKEEIDKPFIIRSVMIYLCAVAVIVISWFMEFGLAGDLVFCACGVLGMEIENRQLLGVLDEHEDSFS